MLQDKKIKQHDYVRSSQLLGELFKFEIHDTEEISRCIEYYGVEEFFRKLETFDFTVDIFEKLHAVRQVLYGMSEVAIMPKGFIDEMMKGYVKDKEEEKENKKVEKEGVEL